MSTGNVVGFQRRPSAARLECSKCGASTDAACNCGVGYVPAGERAAKAAAANPGKSARAIAADAGVSKDTVRNARSGGEKSPPDKQATGRPKKSSKKVGRVTGRDGKSYPAKQKRKPAPVEPPEPGIEDEIDREDPKNLITAFLLRADQAIHFAVYSGKVNKEIVAAARAAAAAWSKLEAAVNLTAADPIEAPCEDCQTPEQFWQRSLSNIAGDAISLPAYWTRQFGEWEKFEVTSELVTLAQQAAEAWASITSELKRHERRR